MRHRGRTLLALSFATLCAFPAAAQTTASCGLVDVAAGELVASGVGQLASFRGEVLIDDVPARQGQVICPGEVVRVGQRSRAMIYLYEADTTLRLDEHSLIKLEQPEAEESGIVEMLSGALYFLSRVRRSLEVRTPYVTAGVDGTEFEVRILPEGSRILLFEGDVSLRDASGEKQGSIVAGQAAMVGADMTPEITSLDGASTPYGALRVAAGESVGWTLYYPPLFLGAGDDAATARIEELLASGQVDEAEAALRAMSGDARAMARRDALLSIIALARDERDEAARLAARARAAAPDQAFGYLASAYAAQALLRIDEAAAILGEGIAAIPDSVPLLASLAEVRLMQGRVTEARALAERAAGVPGADDAAKARIAIVRGFVALASFDTATAGEAFAAAIALEAQNPLPWLGSGLALIRQGKVEEGRSRIEVALAHDPNDALLRSYLGRAYAAERRSDKAFEQYAIAGALDPADPTPWFYDSILKELENRPIEALMALERSIALNDNRGVYRSRFLLDQDRASRGVSRSRIYSEIGFDELGVREATRALATDPANNAAHRQLANLYRTTPRHEVARVSELLQAQLLQPVGHNPVQPSLAFADLERIDTSGPARVGFNEYTPLFQQEGVQGSITGIAGNMDTLGDEAMVSVLQGRTNISAGQFHFETEGFRPNNDLKHDIYTLFAQHAVNDKLSLQAEYRRRETEKGDRVLSFEPDNADESLRRDVDIDVLRVGGHYEASPGLDMIASLVWTKQEASFFESEENSGFPPIIPAFTDIAIDEVDDRGLQGEFQVLGKRERFNFVTGATVSNVDRKQTTILDSDPCIFGFGCPIVTTTNDDRNTYAGYGYGYFDLPADLRVTLGASVDVFRSDGVDRERINPKLGVEWQPVQSVTLRGTAFSSLKRDLAVEQTIEPTQIAGFNQIEDEPSGSGIDTLGVGIDLRPSSRLALGADYIVREVSTPRSINSGGKISQRIADRDEYRLGTYAYYTLSDRVALSGEVEWWRFQQPSKDAINEVEKLETILVPLGAYFSEPGGFFTRLGMTWVYQAISRFDGGGSTKDHDDAFLFDAQVGFKLPDHRGKLSFEVSNILDESFAWRDDNFRTVNADTPVVLPARTVLLRLSLNF